MSSKKKKIVIRKGASPFDAISNPFSEQIASARSFLLKRKLVPILEDCPPLRPTFADICGLPDLSDATIKRILGTSIKNPFDLDKHAFGITANSWVVATRPLLVKKSGVGEKVTVFDEKGKRHSRVAYVYEDTEDPDDDMVGIWYDDGDCEVGEVDRSCIWPEIRKTINIYSLSKEEKAILSKAVIAFPPPSKTLIENLISSAGCSGLERSVVVLLKKMIEAGEIVFPGISRAKLYIMGDGLLVDVLFELVEEGKTDPVYVYIQAKTDSSAFNSLHRTTNFRGMLGYGKKVVVLSICTRTLFGAITGKELIESDPWFALPVEEETEKTKKKDAVDAVPLSTFLHFNGDRVKKNEMKLTYSPLGAPDEEGTVLFSDEEHNIDAAFSDPTLALQWIANEAVSDAPRIPVHSCRRFADFTFAPGADNNRKEACEVHVFKAKLGLSDDQFRFPEAQNSHVDIDILSSAFLVVPALNKLLRTGEYSDIVKRILDGEVFYVRTQFKTLVEVEVKKKEDGSIFVKKWECAHFGKRIGGKKSGRYDRDDFDLSFFASFDYPKQTIDFRALWNSELIENNPLVFDSPEECCAHIYFHCEKKRVYKGGWAWTFGLEEDAIRGCSVRFAEETDKDLDAWMMVLFEGSKNAGPKKRPREE